MSKSPRRSNWRRERHLTVRSQRRDEPDLDKLAKALVAFTLDVTEHDDGDFALRAAKYKTHEKIEAALRAEGIQPRRPLHGCECHMCR